MYMLDANVCIEFMRGRLPGVYKMFQETSPRCFKIPAVVEAELYLGAEKSAHPAKNRLLVERFLEPFEVIPFDSRCALVYARLRVGLEQEGRRIGPNDMLIAATALAHHAILVTRNVGEFKRVPGLSIEYWDEMEF